MFRKASLTVLLLAAVSMGAQTDRHENLRMHLDPQRPQHLGSGKVEQPQHFRITCPRPILPNQPVEVMAKDRLWAIMGLGCTVWTDKEWEDAEKNRKLMEDLCKKDGNCGTSVPIQELKGF